MGARTTVLLFTLLLTLYFPLAGLAQKQVTVLRGATLIDVTNSTRIENSVVIMESGRFTRVGKDGQDPPLTERASRIALRMDSESWPSTSRTTCQP